MTGRADASGRAAADASGRAVAGPARAPRTAPGGPLLLSVQRQPWAVSFGLLDLAGPAWFATVPRRPAGPALASMAEPAQPPDLAQEERYQLTEAVEFERAGDTALRAVLDTSHPSAKARVEIGRGFGQRAETVTVTVTVDGAAVVGQDFTAGDGERFLGFGERSHAVSLDRGVVENYVGEGPWQPHEYPFLPGIIPSWAGRNRPDASYFPLPWVLSTRGYGLSIDQDDLSYVRLREASGTWSIEAEAPLLRYTVYAGPTPLQALRRYTAITGRQPAPERWFFGPWYQTGHGNHVPLAEEQRQAEALGDAPASAAETHCRYLPLGEDRGHEESERARTAFFHSRGMAVLSYINAFVGTDYAQAFRAAAERGALQCDTVGRPYLFQTYAGGREPPQADEAQYDFTSPRGARCWAEVAGRMTAAGYDGWMEDFGEYTPLDAVAADGSTGVAAHNCYATQFHAAAARAAAGLERAHGRRLARFARSGWTGTAAVMPIVWSGDHTTCWGFDGLASAVTCGLSMGASGVAMWGSDTGGFVSTLDRLTPELLRRWIQFSAFTPVMRTKSSGIEIPAYHRPQIWDRDILPGWRRWSRWHTRLNDYLMAAHDRYRATGRPIMCALELACPELGPVADQYLLGEDLLVAPILEPGDAAGHVTRRVTLPPGRWADLFRPGQTVAGPGVIEVEAGPDDIPVFLRAGAALALLPDDIHSLSPYAPQLPDRRSLLAIPPAEQAQDRTVTLGPGIRCRSIAEPATAGQRWWTLELQADRDLSWELAAPLPGPPGAVQAAGPWSVDAGMLRCPAHGASVEVRVLLAGQETQSQPE